MNVSGRRHTALVIVYGCDCVPWVLRDTEIDATKDGVRIGELEVAVKGAWGRVDTRTAGGVDVVVRDVFLVVVGFVAVGVSGVVIDVGSG
jgi:hypothetical protein